MPGEGSGPKRLPEGEVPPTQPERKEAPMPDVRRRLMGALNHQMTGGLQQIGDATHEIESLFQGGEQPKGLSGAIASVEAARQHLDRLTTSFSIILANAGDTALLEEIWRNMGQSTTEQDEFFSNPKAVREIIQKYREAKNRGSV